MMAGNVSVLEVWILSYFLILCRVAAIVFTVPAFSSQNMPRLVKVGLSVALATFWFFDNELAPSDQTFQLAANPRWIALGLAVAREIIFGAFLGYTFGLLLLPFRLAGSYIGQEVGFTMSELTDPTSHGTVNVFGQFMEVLAMILFFSLDIHHLLFTLMNGTFARIPIGGGVTVLPVDIISTSVAEAHRQGIILVAPAAIVMFSTIVVLSYVAKTSPQLNLFSVGMNIRLVAGLFAMFVFLPEMLSFGERLLSRGAEVFRLIMTS